MQYRIIFLQKGLEKLNDYQFRKVKCILADALNVTANVREDYDRIQVTEQMFAKFPDAECVFKLIEAIKGDNDLKCLAKSLQEQMQEVSRGQTAGGAAAPKRRKQMGTTGPSAPACSTSGPGTSQRVGEAPVAQKRKKKCTQDPSNSQGSTAPRTPTQRPLLASAQPCTSQDPSPAAFSPELTVVASAQNTRPQEPRTEASSHILQGAPILVKVLKVIKTKTQSEFLPHAIVATTTEFFPVKVFDRQLKDRFVCKKVLCISQYIRAKGFLEVTEESSVTETTQQLSVPQANLRIAKLCQLTPGTVLSGFFTLAKKTTKKEKTVYEIKNKEKSMNVVGRGQCHNVACHAGDQLWLFHFRLRTQKQEMILSSEEDSYIQVIERRRSRGSTIPERSATNMSPVMLQTPQTPRSSDSQTESPCAVPPASRAPQGAAVLHRRPALPTAATSSPCILLTPAAPHSPAHSSCSTHLPTRAPPSSPQRSSCPQSVSRLVDTFQEQGQQAQRKMVLVLSVTEPFSYHEGRSMFHATVAIENKTQNQIIHVKVFHEGFRTEFVLGNIVVLSNYIGRNGFLEVYRNTLVEKVGVTDVPKWLISMVTETPKISALRQQAPHTTVNGVFLVMQKVERPPCVYYEIQDDTGTMEVMVFGHLTRIPCAVGNRMQLICFELGENRNQLRSLIHSFLKVV